MPNLKELLLAIVCSGLAFTGFSDAWDDMTISEAKKVEKFVKKNPFIIDYCDCCSSTEAFLFQVTSTEIVTCSWNEEKWSVKAYGKMVAKIDQSGRGLSKYDVYPKDQDTSLILTMNYVFGFDKRMKWAVPLFKMVGYSRDHICKGATEYPIPESRAKEQLSVAYRNWYTSKIQKTW